MSLEMSRIDLRTAARALRSQPSTNSLSGHKPIRYPVVMSDRPTFCEYCLGHEDAEREEAPHECMLVRTRLSSEGRRRQYVCTNCCQVWERTVSGWFRWFKPEQLWEPEIQPLRHDDGPMVVPTELE